MSTIYTYIFKIDLVSFQVLARKYANLTLYLDTLSCVRECGKNS